MRLPKAETKEYPQKIEINGLGDFIRTFSYGRHTKKEGIYSPITQNRRHLELIKQIRIAEKRNILTKALFEKYFYDGYRSIVVLSNPKTVLFDRYAKKEVRAQVIKADQLAQYIRKIDSDANVEATSEKSMEELARFFISIHKAPKIDYTDRFRAAVETANTTVETQVEEAQPAYVEKATEIICPKCGAVMIKRKAAKGPNAGKEFYGCSSYPKCRCIINIQ